MCEGSGGCATAESAVETVASRTSGAMSAGCSIFVWWAEESGLPGTCENARGGYRTVSRLSPVGG